MTAQDLQVQKEKQEQVNESQSPENKYFFWLKTGKSGDEATNHELLEYYLTNGGAEGFRVRMNHLK